MRNLRKRLTAFVLSSALAICSPGLATAYTTYGATAGMWDAPTSVYAFSAGYGGFYSVPFVATSTCLYDMYFIDTTTAAGSAIFSLLVTAHASGEKVVNIYYNIAGNGWCWIDRLDIYRP